MKMMVADAVVSIQMVGSRFGVRMQKIGINKEFCKESHFCNETKKVGQLAQPLTLSFQPFAEEMGLWHATVGTPVTFGELSPVCPSYTHPFASQTRHSAKHCWQSLNSVESSSTNLAWDQSWGSVVHQRRAA